MLWLEKVKLSVFTLVFWLSWHLEMEMTPSQTAGENGSGVAGKGNHCFTPDLQKRALITLP